MIALRACPEITRFEVGRVRRARRCGGSWKVNMGFRWRTTARSASTPYHQQDNCDGVRPRRSAALHFSGDHND